MTTGITLDLASLLRLRFSANKLPLFSPHKTKAMQAGTKQSAHLGRGMDFAEVRPYQAGDDVRHINWRLTARTGKPYSKIYQEERERPVYVLVDQRSSMKFGTRKMFKSVLAGRLSALFAWAALKHNDQVGGMVFNEQEASWITPKRQRKTIMQLLSNVVQFANQKNQPDDNDALLSALQKLNSEIRSGSIVVVLSDFMQLSSAAQQLLTKLSRYNTVLSVLIHDPIEAEPPKNNIFMFTDGDAKLEFDGASKKYCQLYQSLYQQRLQQLQNLANKTSMRLLPVATNDDVVHVLSRVVL